MIANILIAVGFGFIGIAIGAMVLDQYHERHATAAELAAVRELYARSEAMLDAVSRECAYLRAQRSTAEALHAERIRNALEAARWN